MTLPSETLPPKTLRKIIIVDGPLSRINQLSTSHLASLLVQARQYQNSVRASIHDVGKEMEALIQTEFVRRDRILGLVT